jgi:hypothetical protein
MRGTMYRAEIERMPGGSPDQLRTSGLWRVMIYEEERFVRSDKDNITHAMATKLAEELNFHFTGKRKAKGAS